MQTLSYEIDIAATRSHVWDTMFTRVTYKQWVKAFSADSTYEGVWAEGELIRFVDPNMGGTQARLEVFKPYEKIVAIHLATVSKEGELDTEGEMARKWIGTKETYLLEDVDFGVRLRIEMETHEDFVEMFEACWPKALQIIRSLSEAS